MTPRKKKLPTKAELRELKACAPDARLEVRAADATITGAPPKSWPPAMEILKSPGMIVALGSGASAALEISTRPEFSPLSITAWAILVIAVIAACLKGYFAWASDTRKLVVTQPEEQAA